MKLKAFFIALLSLAFINPHLNAQNNNDYWPNWRGSNADGVSLNGTPPVEWSESKNIKWKIPIPGKGLGTPVVWEDQIFITTTIELDEQATKEAIERLKIKEQLSGISQSAEFIVASRSASCCSE